MEAFETADKYRNPIFLIFAGFGGQGMMLAGMLTAYAGMSEGKEVAWMPSYGPEMRGGTANCHVILSDKPISSPVVIHATSIIAMNKPSMEKFEKCLVPNGTLLVNSSLVDKKTLWEDAKAFYIPANELAEAAGSNKTANIAMLGAFIRITGVLYKQSIINAIVDMLGKKKEKLLSINMQAFQKGYEYAEMHEH